MSATDFTGGKEKKSEQTVLSDIKFALPRTRIKRATTL